jgi:uncharacterized protein (TIGR04255 family)
MIGQGVETIKNLNQKPLVEAIFELRWGLDGPPGMAIDPYYQMLIGQMFAAIKESYPHWERLPVAELPEGFTSFMPHHQFRVGADAWPLIQMGPGLLTVNDTEGYVWETFFPRCAAVIETLFRLYPEATEKLRIFEISLRYIDADSLLGLSPVDFLRNLKLNVDAHKSLFEGGRIGANSLGLGLSLAYPALYPKGLFQISCSQGKKHNQDAMIWETQVVSRGADAPRQPETINVWLQEAHDTIHDWFFRQIDGPLLEKYR